MLRYIFLGLAAAALVSTSFIPDEAQARGGRGVGVRGGAVGAGAYRGHVAHPIAGRGVAYRGVRRGVAVGAAVGAAGYYGGGYYNNNDCYRDGYGRLICPNQNQY